MKHKILIILLILFSSIAAKSQTTLSSCVATTCSHNLPYTQTIDTIFSLVTGFTPQQYVWTIASGPGVLGSNGGTNIIITGLQPGKSTNVNLTVIGSNGNVTSSTTISVAPTPVPPPLCPVTILKITHTDSVYYTNGTIIVNKRTDQ